MHHLRLALVPFARTPGGPWHLHPLSLHQQNAGVALPTSLAVVALDEHALPVTTPTAEVKSKRTTSETTSPPGVFPSDYPLDPPPHRGKLRLSTATTCWPLRSEEHTSELQSHVNLVCRLL